MPSPNPKPPIHHCLHPPRRPDPLNLQPLITILLLRFHQHPFHGRRHHHREDPDPGLEDHAPYDPLHILIADHLLIAVQTDLVLLFLDIDPQPNIPKIAEHLPLTDDGHRQDDAHQQVIDVLGPILRLVPELLFVLLEAMRLYYDQQHVLRIRISFPHQMLMTLGAIGPTATIQQTTIVTPPDPDPLWDHHLLIHHQTHLHTQQHHLEPWLSVYLMVTAKPQMQPKHFQFHTSTKKTLKSTNFSRLLMTHNEYDA